MSSETVGQSRYRRVRERITGRIRTTLALVAGLLTRRDSLGVALTVALGYLFAFLYMMQDVFVETEAGFGVSVPVADPLSVMFQPGPGLFAFEAIAVIELGVISWTFSPLNTAMGLGLSILVGLNMGLTYLAVTQPTSCGIGASSGILASVPALFAGGACCAPVVAIVFGIQMSAVLVTAFLWLLPAGAALLVVSLVYIAGKVDPAAI